MSALKGLLACWLVAGAAWAEDSKIQVVTTLPDLKSIAEFVGGDLVTAVALSRGNEDPHYVTPRPSLMGLVNRADLFVEIGLDLELWTERVLEGARNPQVRVGSPGHVYASDGVPRREIPQSLSRSGGDLHPQGNPHIWLDPLNGKILAANIAAGLKRVAPQHAAAFDARLQEFERRLDEKLFGPDLVSVLGGPILTRLARRGDLFSFLGQKEFQGEKMVRRLGGWLKEGESFRGRKVVTFHSTWVYFAERFGLEIAATIEEKPGIPPSARRREELIRLVRDAPVRVIAVENFYDFSAGKAVADATSAACIVIPVMTDGVPEARDYFSLFDALVKALNAAFSGREARP
ncbi:MAG: zinc ABC transporter substrate-binding protein [Planctomycetes bacterium]|nr:zinc ABC transporter substrate-binding protein [Planctomycetota bacterium]